MPQATIDLKAQSWIAHLSEQGRVFYASDAAQGDLVTGQTSFAVTTPTFQLRVPTGQVAIPLMVALNQSGIVAGGGIDIINEIDNADRYSTGGTTETIFPARTDSLGPLTGSLPTGLVFRTNPTATAGYGIRIDGVTVGQDISPAEGQVNQYLWTPTGGFDFLVGPASWNVYTYAATTGPTWFWTFKFAVVPSGYLSGIADGTAG